MKALGGPALVPRAIAAFLLLLAPLGAFSQPKAPPAPKHFFTDSTGVVPAVVAAQIEQRLRDFQKTSSNQILVVVSDRLPAGYTSMEEYTNRTAQAWRVGVKARDNGAVLFVFVSDRKVRIEVGYGLEGALPDALASRIINNEITPRFKEGNYGAGLLAGVDAIVRATRGEYRPIATRANIAPVRPIAAPANAAPFRPIGDDPVVLFFGFVLFILILYWILKAAARVDANGSMAGSDWSSGTDWSSGGSSSSSDSSGFSGGGGSFGGGGASGSW